MSSGIVRQIVGEISQEKLKGKALESRLDSELGNQERLARELPKTQKICYPTVNAKR